MLIIHLEFLGDLVALPFTRDISNNCQTAFDEHLHKFLHWYFHLEVGVLLIIPSKYLVPQCSLLKSLNGLLLRSHVHEKSQPAIPLSMNTEIFSWTGRPSRNVGRFNLREGRTNGTAS